jgi:hypothetical protein
LGVLGGVVLFLEIICEAGSGGGQREIVAAKRIERFPDFAHFVRQRELALLAEEDRNCEQVLHIEP